MANLSNINNKFLVTTGGNVGIGTTSPSAKLHVNGVVTANDSIQVQNDDSSFVCRNSAGTVIGTIGAESSSTPNIGRFTVRNNGNIKIDFNANGNSYLNGGNVGIGTSTPQTTLDVKGAASALNAHFGQGTNNSSGVYGGISLGYSEAANANYRKVGIVAKAIGDGAARQELHFLVDSNADGGSASIADSKMMIDITGNVIIGNTAVDNPNSLDRVLEIEHGGSVGVILNDSRDTPIGLENRGAVFHLTHNTNSRLVVDGASGNVGIGTTLPTSPASVTRFLEIEGSTAGIVLHDNGNDPYEIWASGGNLVFRYNNTAGENGMLLSSTGNLGIGSTSPSSKLHVVGANNTTAVKIDFPSADFDFSANSTSGYTTKFHMDNTGTYIGNNSAGRALIFQTNDTNRLSINGNTGGVVIYNELYNEVSIATGTTKIGYNAGLSVSNSAHNTYFGYYAGRANTGTRNTVVGSQAAYQGTSTMNYNVIIGYNAAKTATNQLESNVIIGDNAMSTGSGASGTVIIGQAAGVNNTRNYLVAVGNQAAYSQTDAAANTRIGYNSGYHCTVGNYNTSVGYQSMQENTNQSNSTAVGYRAQYYHTSGNENVYVGYNAGFSTSASTAYENTIIGSNAAGSNNNLSGAANTSLGRYTMYYLSSGTSNTALGHQAMLSLTSGDANTGVGKNSLAEVEGGSRNTGLGTGSGQNITSGSDNIAIGYESLYNQLTNGQNIAIGVNAARDFTGSRLVAIGYNAAKQLTSDVDNVFIGQDTGHHRISGTDNTFVGAYANYNGNATGGGNTGVGKSTGYSLTSGASNTLVGKQAGYSITDGTDNTMVGHNTGIFVTGSGNTYMGSYAGDASSSSGSYNTGIGRAGLSAVTSGTYHTALGYNAGDEITTGTNCTAIGHAAGSGSSPRHMTTNSNEIVIGNNSIVGAYVRVAWTTGSDKRDKINFSDVPHGLDFVNKLKPTSYDLRKERDSDETIGERKYGFIAQEILELEGDNPVIIDNSDENKLALQDSNLIPILVNAIKELKAEIDELKK